MDLLICFVLGVITCVLFPLTFFVLQIRDLLVKLIEIMEE